MGAGLWPTRDNTAMTDHALYAEALATFAALFDAALAAGEPDRTAMTLATATLDAQPAARTVLLKHFDARGCVDMERHSWRPRAKLGSRGRT